MSAVWHFSMPAMSLMFSVLYFFNSKIIARFTTFKFNKIHGKRQLIAKLLHTHVKNPKFEPAFFSCDLCLLPWDLRFHFWLRLTSAVYLNANLSNCIYPQLTICGLGESNIASHLICPGKLSVFATYKWFLYRFIPTMKTYFYISLVGGFRNYYLNPKSFQFLVW